MGSMISTTEEENQIVRWVFAELMSYLRETHNRYWFKWHPRHMKVHKIMYQTFEQADVPVTRSWYRYGCFIHSNQLAGSRDFSSLKNRYLWDRGTHPRLESTVTRMGFDVDSIREALYETIDAMPPRMSIFVKALYQNAPESFRDVYLTKRALHLSLKRAKDFSFEDLSKLQTWLLKVRNNISRFHMAAFSNEQFADLSEIVMTFTTSVEEALLKTMYLVTHKERVSKKKIGLMRKFAELFDWQVWLPFALGISAQTAKGFRAVEIKDQQLRKKKYKISESLDALATHSATLAVNDLALSWREYRDLFKQSPSRITSELCFQDEGKTSSRR